jgi:protein involved in polysaccharide export with SLBB domain
MRVVPGAASPRGTPGAKDAKRACSAEGGDVGSAPRLAGIALVAALHAGGAAGPTPASGAVTAEPAPPVLLRSLRLSRLPGLPTADATGSGDEPAGPPPPYRLQPDDELSIRVFGRPELDETVRVRPDGRISVLLAEEVAAAGRTAEELDRELTDRYARYFRDPRVSVNVRDFAGLAVYLGGEVERPGLVPLRGRLTALAAVLAAGGFRSSARKDSVILLRDAGGDRPLALRLNLEEVITKGTPDVVLRPYDVVYVPMSRIAKVDKFVDEYVRRLLPVTLSAGFTYLKGNEATIVASPR